MKHKCNNCWKSFKTESELDTHQDEHTPYWIGKKIRLSGADQIRLLLKHWAGSWKNYIKQEQNRVKQHKTYHDFEKALALRQFERDNKIQFVVCGDKVESYREVYT